MTSSNPVGPALVAGLSDPQRADVQAVLDGMLRERSGGAGTALLTSAVRFGAGRRPADAGARS